MREALRLLVVARLSHSATYCGQFSSKRRILRGGDLLLLQSSEPIACGVGIADARTAKHHHGRTHALLTQDALGLEQFELQAQRAQFVLAEQINVFVRKTVRGRFGDGAQALGKIV